MEEFINQFKNNRIVRYAIMLIFLLMAYLLGGSVAVLTGLVGSVLGRLSYNDVVEDIDV